MSSEKTLAIVVRVVEFSETSCVVTLFTRDFGKIGALAKGARRPKSPFESALDLLAVCRIVFLHKSSESLDLLTEAKLERRFRAATRDLVASLRRILRGRVVARLDGHGRSVSGVVRCGGRGLLELEGESGGPAHRASVRNAGTATVGAFPGIARLCGLRTGRGD